jgi:hypothetical protein
MQPDLGADAGHRPRSWARAGVRALGGLLGVLAAAFPLVAILVAARIGILPMTVLLPLSPWIAFGLPIGAAAGLIVGAVLAPSAWRAGGLEWWLAGRVSYVAWLVGLGIAGVWGFIYGSGEVGERALLGAFMVMAGLPMLIVAVPAALVWVALMRLAAAAGRRIASSA